MFKQFKEFAFKGNLVDMAVGFILGGAFATVVKSLVSNIIMPVIGNLIGGVDFTKMKHIIVDGVPAKLGPDGKTVVTAAVEEVSVKYGQFITDTISFVILAFVIFIIVKKFVTAFEKKKEEEPAKPEEPSKQEVLLTEIRDNLKK
jgi:large conductance mechanosensitive channel